MIMDLPLRELLTSSFIVLLVSAKEAIRVMKKNLSSRDAAVVLKTLLVS